MDFCRVLRELAQQLSQALYRMTMTTKMRMIMTVSGRTLVGVLRKAQRRWRPLPRWHRSCV